MSLAIKPIEGFTFGCDPELFVLNDKGMPVSAAGLIPGTKEQPFPVPGGAVQVDGMAAEFNTTPADNFGDFNRNITMVMKTLEGMLPKGYSLSVVPAVRFDPQVFADSPDEAKILGCNPDFNAWTGDMNLPPCDPADPYLRTASGHLHIGWGCDLDITSETHTMHCRDLVKQLDWYLGAWSLKMDPDPTRRKLYGKAGAYRPKTYGVEYRVLSNFWITSRERRMTVWNRLQTGIFEMRRRFIPEKVPADANDLLVESINESVRNPILESSFNYPLRTIQTYYARF